MNPNLFLQKSRSSAEEESSLEIERLLNSHPMPTDQLISNFPLFMHPRDIARILFFNHIYSLVVEVPGIIIDFGTRWGTNMALFSSLRNIYDSINKQRIIVGFDTFKGFPNISAQDGNSSIMEIGRVSVPLGYEKYLNSILELHNRIEPLGHLKKFEICIGDASEEIQKYFTRQPQTIVSLAFFDMNLYKPTKDCLEAIKPRLVKGSVVAFDELNDPSCPGETQALQEVFGLNNIELLRFRPTSRVSYFIIS
jgi:hypothetical protein